jgi:hypothetical protein
MIRAAPMLERLLMIFGRRIHWSRRDLEALPLSWLLRMRDHLSEPGRA